MRGAAVRFLLALVFALPAFGSGALAHEGGAEVYRGEAGPYFLQAYWLHMEETNFVAYTIGLRQAENRRPVDDATITVTAETPAGALQPVQTQVFANQYQFFFRLEEPGLWRMRAEIEGPPGRGRLEHAMTVTEDPRTAAAPPGGAADGAIPAAAATAPASAFLDGVRERPLIAALLLLAAGLTLAACAVSGRGGPGRRWGRSGRTPAGHRID